MEGKAGECGRIGGAFLEEERRRLGEEWYRQEYEGEFVGAEGSVFREEWIRRALEGWDE